MRNVLVLSGTADAFWTWLDGAGRYLEEAGEVSVAYAYKFDQLKNDHRQIDQIVTLAEHWRRPYAAELLLEARKKLH